MIFKQFRRELNGIDKMNSNKKVGKRHKTLNIITLGCAKNLVDSEKIVGQLTRVGWEVVFDSSSVEASVVVINTCGFIGDAKEESVNMILECVRAKERGDIERLYVIGCLSERYADELRAELPEVDQFFGVRDLTEIVKELGEEWRYDLVGERVLSTPKHYAYLKISEGCNWGCGYCAIPLIRGKHISVPMEELVEEARKLAKGGVKELMVIAQDTTYYGMDLYGERRLGELLRRLCEVDGVEWIRLHYAYPTQFPEDVIDVMASEPKICKYIDIPLQHISDSQLKSMRRGIDKQETIELIDKLRERIPEIAIRTTMLVGYPNETDTDFEELLEFVEKSKFERLGVFPYSEEEGTHSAKELRDNVDESVKEERVARLMELQSEIALSNNARLIGRRMRVMVDRREDDFYVGRTEYDSPEVDQEVLIVAPQGSMEQPRIGEFGVVEITQVQEYDIYGRLI